MTKTVIIITEDLNVVVWEIDVLTSRRLEEVKCTSYPEALIKGKEFTDKYNCRMVDKYKRLKQLNYGYN